MFKIHIKNVLVLTFYLNFVLCVAVDPEEQLIKAVIKKCSESPSRITCFANKAATALDRAMSWDIELFDGVKLVRNDEPLQNKSVSEARASMSGIPKLTSALSSFLQTHTLSVDWTNHGGDRQGRAEEHRKGGGGGGGGGLSGGGGGGGKNQRGYSKYAFMVLLGIFGLTGPLFMKTLAIMAAKALIASKVALIIVGSVALKKLFEKDHEPGPKIKVHTIHEDEHDRIYNWSPYDRLSYYKNYNDNVSSSPL